MRSPCTLLRFIAKAVMNAAAGGLPVGDFFVDVLPEIAHRRLRRVVRHGHRGRPSRGNRGIGRDSR